MMVDFVTGSFPCELPCDIHDGVMVRVGLDGDVQWETKARLMVSGSYDNRVAVRAVSRTELEISGNLAKFLQGHNIFGPSDLPALIRAFLEKVQPTLWPDGMPWIGVNDGQLSRVDCTSGFLLDSQADVLTWIRAAEQRTTVSHRGRGVLKGEGTLVYGDATGKRAKAWQLTFYAKGLEIAKHPLPEPMMQRNDVLSYVGRLLRCEVRLRSAELNRFGLRTVRDWQPDSCEKVWRSKLARVDFMEGVVMDCSAYEGVKPRLLDAFDAWKAGRDLRQGRPARSFYRLRTEMKETFGVDIAVSVPASNVIPLRRTIVAVPVHRPPWADEVTALLVA